MEFTCSRCAVQIGVEFEAPVSVMDTCAYCGSGPTSAEMATTLLYQFRRRHGLPADRVGRGLRFRKADIESFLRRSASRTSR